MKLIQLSSVLTVILLAVLLSQDASAQAASKRVIGSFVIDSFAYTYEFTKLEEDRYTFNISSVTDTEEASTEDEGDEATPTTRAASVYPLGELTLEKFKVIFQDQMSKKYNLRGNHVSDAAYEVFWTIKAKLDPANDEPTTAYFILKKDHIWSFLRSNWSGYYYKGGLSKLIAPHYIHRVDIETEDGAIKNISVYLIRPEAAENMTSSPRSFLLFKNQFPISISGKFDYEKFSKINLFCFNCSGIDGLTRYIRLSDLAILDIVYENDKEDYSPSNRTFSVMPSKPIAGLKKEKRSKILEVAAFTDFVGLDRAEPNGLIQIEAKRRININTKSRLFARGKKSMDKLSQINLAKVKTDPLPERTTNSIIYKVYPDKGEAQTIKIPRSRFRSVYFNFFGYVEPSLLFSKLEQNNRFIDSAKGASGILDPVSLYQYQLASFGIKLQFFRLSIPQIKIQWNAINVGAYWSRSRVALTTDSAGPSVPLNSNYWQFGSNVIFRPDNRWGASMGFEYILPRIWNDDYKVSNRKGVFQKQFDAWYKTGDDGKLFFRYRWTYENKNRNNNFTQIQLGYSLNLFAGSTPTEDKKK